MLDTVCPDCMVPIMRSRKGVEACIICDQAYKQEATTSAIAQPIKEKDSGLPDDAEYANMLAEYEAARGLPVTAPKKEPFDDFKKGAIKAP